jgi:hypothetical protein
VSKLCDFEDSMLLLLPTLLASELNILVDERWIYDSLFSLQIKENVIPIAQAAG